MQKDRGFFRKVSSSTLSQPSETNRGLCSSSAWWHQRFPCARIGGGDRVMFPDSASPSRRFSTRGDEEAGRRRAVNCGEDVCEPAASQTSICEFRCRQGGTLGATRARRCRKPKDAIGVTEFHAGGGPPRWPRVRSWELQGAGSGMVGEVEGIGGLREERRARCVCWISWRGVVRWWMRARSDGINGDHGGRWRREGDRDRGGGLGLGLVAKARGVTRRVASTRRMGMGVCWRVALPAIMVWPNRWAPPRPRARRAARFGHRSGSAAGWQVLAATGRPRACSRLSRGREWDGQAGQGRMAAWPVSVTTWPECFPLSTLFEQDAIGFSEFWSIRKTLRIKCSSSLV